MNSLILSLITFRWKEKSILMGIITYDIKFWQKKPERKNIFLTFQVYNLYFYSCNLIEDLFWFRIKNCFKLRPWKKCISLISCFANFETIRLSRYIFAINFWYILNILHTARIDTFKCIENIALLWQAYSFSSLFILDVAT